MPRSCPGSPLRRPNRVLDVELLDRIGQRRQQPVPKIIRQCRIRWIEAVAVWQEIDKVTQRIGSKDIRGREHYERPNLRERRPIYESLDEVFSKYRKDIFISDLVEAPGLRRRSRMTRAGSQIGDPHVAPCHPEVTREIRIHRVMRERCAARAVAMEHHDGPLGGTRIRVTREPHLARNGYPATVGRFRRNWDVVDLRSDGAAARKAESEWRK